MSNAEFIIENGKLTRYNGAGGDVVIPSNVHTIGMGVFCFCNNLETVSIPSSVTTIEANAFSYRSALREVEMAEGVTEIHGLAFSGCRSLEKINLPNSIEKIGPGAFSSCEKLVKLRLPAGLKLLGGSAEVRTRSSYDGVFANSGIEQIDLPEGLEWVGTYAFAGCKNLKTITIPGTVSVIDDGAFAGCDYLETVIIQEGVKKIGKETFKGCSQVKTMSIPESIEEIGENAFLRCGKVDISIFPEKLAKPEKMGIWGIGDENGCVIADKVLTAYSGEPGIVRITEGVEKINAGVFNHLFGWRKAVETTQIILPDSLVYFDENSLSRTVNINVPKGFLQRREKQPAKFLLSLLSSPWTHKATPLDYVCVLLFQGGKDMNELCKKRLGWKPQEAAEAFLEVTSFGLKGPEYVKGAEFIFEHKDKINQETVDAFFAAAKSAKAKKAADLLQPIVSGGDEKEEKPLRPIEAFCREQFVEHYLDKIIKKADLYGKSFEGILYADTKAPAPAFVVKCAIVPYIGLMEERPKHIGAYKTDWLRTSFIENADKVAAELDAETFIKALENIAHPDFMGYDKPQCLIPLCRYGNGAHIQQIVSAMGSWDNWNRYGASGRSAIVVARGAIFLNESREAMLYAEKCKLLRVYAAMRGLDEDVLRDTKLSDFGLDENGKKLFDLDNTVIEASVGQDLSINLYDTTANKVVKSLPKKGADPDKHATATAELSDLKKNLKKVVKTRNDILFERFLDGKSQKAPAWISSYTKNPTLHRIAELMVWSQKGKTFILTATGAINHNGDVYQVNDTDAICVAHPKDMKAEELAAWQNYFTSHGLKQPFEQIWEPVVDSATVTEDRYKDCMIPFYRFKGREKHGIYIQDWDFHNQIDISFDGCNATVERIDWARHEIDMNHRFAVQSISFRALTRKVNHILAYLDRITVYDRIVKDDVSVAQFLPSFTLAQITEFIKLASENNCPNVTAILLDFQQKNFPNFDPMAEFTLD